MVDDFLEDAVVHLQLRQFFLATESLRDAAQTVNLVEQYLSKVAERDQFLQYVANVSTARQRVYALERSITSEGTRSD